MNVISLKNAETINVISLKNVDFSYNGVPVLENATLSIPRGEFVSVVGPNGGGKTTLLKLILGLLRPKSGEIRVFDQEPAQARRRIGYTPQFAHYDPQFPVTVLDVVLMGRVERRWGGPYARADKAAAAKALDEVGLSKSAAARFHEISGGQRQRVLMARALACEPEMLLLDEPTASIDVASETRLLEILRRLNERMTILLVTHDLGFVSHVVQSVVCVNRRVVVHPTSEITGEIIQEIYGDDLKMIRHDHRCAEEGHEHA